MAQAKQEIVFFCTYKNAETGQVWRKSREYKSIEELIAKMTPYLAKNPRTTVTYQTRTYSTGQF